MNIKKISELYGKYLDWVKKQNATYSRDHAEISRRIIEEYKQRRDIWEKRKDEREKKLKISIKKYNELPWWKRIFAIDPEALPHLEFDYPPKMPPLPTYTPPVRVSIEGFVEWLVKELKEEK